MCLTCPAFPVIPRRKNEISGIDIWKQKVPCGRFLKASTCSLRRDACVQEIGFTNSLIYSINEQTLEPLLGAKCCDGYWGHSLRESERKRCDILKDSNKRPAVGQCSAVGLLGQICRKVWKGLVG